MFVDVLNNFVTFSSIPAKMSRLGGSVFAFGAFPEARKYQMQLRKTEPYDFLFHFVVFAFAMVQWLQHLRKTREININN
jgi:hypothetical protein